MPKVHHMTQSEVIDYLRRQVFEDAVASGWLKECARKPGAGRTTVFYATADVELVSLRISGGEYPEVTAGSNKKRVREATA